MPDLPPKLTVEALLFSSGKTMSVEQLAQLSKLDEARVKRALASLQKEYEARDSAITIYSDPTGWKMMVRDAYVPTVKNIVADTELSRACLETLAVVAYKQPKVLQSEVVEIRGGNAYEHLAELERLGFIAREPEGRSFTVKLTQKFFEYFEVAGKDIKQVFKKVKVPDRTKQQTLGDLEVVEVPAHRPMAVEVLEGKDAGHDAVPAQATEPAAPPHEENGWLEDLDKRIESLSKRNNGHDSDEAFRRKPLPGAEPAAEQKQAQQDAETPPEAEPESKQ